MTRLSSNEVVVGISAYHGDASACVLVGGELVAALEEERIRRVKHWAGFPTLAIQECLRIAGKTPEDVSEFAVARDPRAHLWRKVAYVLSQAPRPRMVSARLQNRAAIGDLPTTIARELGLDEARTRDRTRFVEHHAAHLASAFLVSPFEDAAVCAIDGFGDFVSTSMGEGHGSELRIHDRVFFPHSLGMLYLAITQFLGFRNYGDEFKVMGLAPYGKPEYVDQIRELVRLRPKGRFELDLRYFRHAREGVDMSWRDGEPRMTPVYTDKLAELLGPQREPGAPVTDREEDIARSVQTVFEESAFHILNAVHARVGLPDLALAGGCAMNSVANGKIRANTPFKRVYIQPAAADNGTSLGAAFHAVNVARKTPRRFAMTHGYWGPSFGTDAIDAALRARQADLDAQGCRVSVIEDGSERATLLASRIAEGKVVGRYDGRLEWGARALGNRSILADPRRADMREIINAKIKFREKFRPFAPSVLEEAVDEYFVDAVADPFMIQVYPVREEKRAVIPAVTHVDGSGRLQTVNRHTNPSYWELIKGFEKLTGVPILLNTSFNENEPIVHRPEEALDCFLRTRMDVLALANRVVEKH